MERRALLAGDFQSPWNLRLGYMNDPSRMIRIVLRSSAQSPVTFLWNRHPGANQIYGLNRSAENSGPKQYCDNAHFFHGQISFVDQLHHADGSALKNLRTSTQTQYRPYAVMSVFRMLCILRSAAIGTSFSRPFRPPWAKVTESNNAESIGVMCRHMGCQLCQQSNADESNS